MTSSNYLIGRKKYGRPQGMLWADNPGTFEILNPGTDEEKAFFIPQGFEVGADVPDEIANQQNLNQFIILSDDNRKELSFSVERLEKRERMINGRMRSHHIADKLTISTSWDMLPSRSYSARSNFDLESGKSARYADLESEFTSDGGAGGVQILDWYEKHTGPFWVYLSYDNYKNFGDVDEAYNNLDQYSEVIEMFITSFQYNVVKRGSSNYDFWNISVTLEEV
jgi:hypothetical protein